MTCQSNCANTTNCCQADNNCCNSDCKCEQSCARVGFKAPEITAMCVMEDNTMKSITLSELAAKKYVCLFFYPLDFTFVCPSEILAFNEKVEEFKSRNCVLIGCSVDSHFTHNAWKNTPITNGGIGQISFPLISDLKKCAAKSYCVLHPDGIALRGLFIMDQDFVLRHALVNDLPLGRSVDEALRVLDALQFHEEHGEVCPANWKKGSKAMKASAEGVAQYLKETFSK